MPVDVSHLIRELRKGARAGVPLRKARDSVQDAEDFTRTPGVSYRAYMRELWAVGNRVRGVPVAGPRPPVPRARQMSAALPLLWQLAGFGMRRLEPHILPSFIGAGFEEDREVLSRSTNQASETTA